MKNTIILLAMMGFVAISLAIGLVNLAYGYIDPDKYADDPKLMKSIQKLNQLEKLSNLLL